MCILSSLFNHESKGENKFALFRPVIQHECKTTTSSTDEDVALSDANCVPDDV